MYFLCCLLNWFCIDTIVTGIDLLERTIKLVLLEVNNICSFFRVCHLIDFKLQWYVLMQSCQLVESTCQSGRIGSKILMSVQNYCHILIILCEIDQAGSTPVESQFLGRLVGQIENWTARVSPVRKMHPWTINELFAVVWNLYNGARSNWIEPPYVGMHQLHPLMVIGNSTVK